MDPRFEKTRRAAASHFWYHGFRRFASQVLEDVAGGRTDLRILDCGCGVGQNLPVLAPYGHPIGFELEEKPALASHQYGYPVVRADITRIPFPDASFDLAVSFDVMQCIYPDVAAVREMTRVVRPGGRVLLLVAALDILHGDHSEVWNEFRRYTPATARQLAETAGLTVERVSFAFAALFPLMLTVRTTQRLLRRVRPGPPSEQEIEVPWGPVNATLSLLLDAEAALSRHISMPIGSSLIVIATKPAI